MLLDASFDPEKEFKIIIEHKGVRAHTHTIFHDAKTLEQVLRPSYEEAGRRLGAQVMETIDRWSKGIPPPCPAIQKGQE